MKKLYIIPALLLLFSGFISSQENSEEVVEVSTVEALLALVKAVSYTHLTLPTKRIV